MQLVVSRNASGFIAGRAIDAKYEMRYSNRMWKKGAYVKMTGGGGGHKKRKQGEHA